MIVATSRCDSDYTSSDQEGRGSAGVSFFSAVLMRDAGTGPVRHRPIAGLARPLLYSGAVRLLFDRGTILLLDAPVGVDLSDLPGVLWDPRVRALRAPARHHPAIRAELARPRV